MLHRLNSHGDVAVAGDKNNGEAAVSILKSLLAFQTVHLWHTNVENNDTDTAHGATFMAIFVIVIILNSVTVVFYMSFRLLFVLSAAPKIQELKIQGLRPLAQRTSLRIVNQATYYTTTFVA